jgi:hypothetical protein
MGRHGGGTGATFTVRKMSQGIGVERVFPLHSPNIERIERIKVGSVRRAKLNYLRDLAGKSARIREKMVESGLVDKEFLGESLDAGRTSDQTVKIKTEEVAEEAKAAKE